MRRFRAIADANLGSLISILRQLHKCDVVPTSMFAQRRGGGFIEIKVEFDALSEEAFRGLVDQVSNMPMVVTAVAYEVDWTRSAWL